MIEVQARLKRKNFELDASLQLTQRVNAIYGPSGSGKSTLSVSYTHLDVYKRQQSW